jgi:GNAT superfamily N-acetyltransferase
MQKRIEKVVETHTNQHTPHSAEGVSIVVMRTMLEYPPGLIGTVAALFGRTIAASHGVDWTLDAMIAEQQCEFFRRFDCERDRVWIAMKNGSPKGALTIDGPRPESGREAARLRFFILAESIRGLGLGKLMLAAAMQFCGERSYQRVFLTTLPGLEAAMCLYEAQGFIKVGESEIGFHGSRYVELTMEYLLG